MNQSLTINLHRITDKKRKAKSTLLVDLLKKRQIPGSLAARMCCAYSSEYLVRKCFLLDYYVENGLKINDTRRWIQSAITNDYNESDGFLNWFKRKKEYIMQNGNDDLKQLVV